MKDYTTRQVEDGKTNLKDNINRLMEDFYSKYRVKVCAHSCIKETELKSESGTVYDVFAKIETNIDCYL